MSKSRAWTVLEVSPRRLVALSAVVSASRVEVRKWLSVPPPEGLDPDQAQGVGAWVARELSEAGFRRARALLAVSRGDVVLKVLPLPPMDRAGVGVGEVLSMVRLQMSRQMAVATEGTPIDFTDLPRHESDGGGRRVLVSALPGDRLAWLRAMIEAAGLKTGAMPLRSYGVASVGSELSLRHGGPVLVVAAGFAGLELVVVSEGVPVSARAVDLPRPTDPEARAGFIERAVVEAKRTATSFAGAGSTSVEACGVAGDDELARAMAAALGPALGVPASVLPTPALVALPDSMPEAERAAAAPLIGLLVDASLGRAGVDFANPRRAPDTRARLRQLALAGVLALVVVLGGAGVWGKLRLSALDSQIAVLANRQKQLQTEQAAFLVEHARLNHMEAWLNGRVDWPAHLRRVADLAPEPGAGRFDAWGGTLRSEAVFAPRSRSSRYPDGAWAGRASATIALSGRASGRDQAAGFRGRLVDDGSYGVESRQPDTDDRFALELSAGAAPAGRPAP